MIELRFPPLLVLGLPAIVAIILALVFGADPAIRIFGVVSILGFGAALFKLPGLWAVWAFAIPPLALISVSIIGGVPGLSEYAIGAGIYGITIFIAMTLCVTLAAFRAGDTPPEPNTAAQ